MARSELVVLCGAMFAAGCSPPAAPAAASAAPAASLSSVSGATADPTATPQVPAIVAHELAPWREPSCVEVSSGPDTRLTVDRGRTSEQWIFAGEGGGFLERETRSARGQAVRSETFKFTPRAATVEALWERGFDAEGRLVSGLHDGQPWLSILAWEGTVPAGFADHVHPAPLSLDLDFVLDLRPLDDFLSSAFSAARPQGSEGGRLWSSGIATGVEIHFDRGLPVSWLYSPASKTTLCLYDWEGDHLVGVRCAEGSDSDPPADTIPAGGGDYGWSLRWNADTLTGLVYRGRTGETSVQIKRDAAGRIVELVGEPELRLTIERDESGRRTRTHRWNGSITTPNRSWKNRRPDEVVTYAYTCPAKLPMLPPITSTP